jgi:hypothetical protein
MLRLLLKIIAAIAVLAMSVWIFIHLLPWAIAILALVGLLIKSYHIWLRSRDGGAPPASCWSI